MNGQTVIWLIVVFAVVIIGAQVLFGNRRGRSGSGGSDVSVGVSDSGSDGGGDGGGGGD